MINRVLIRIKVIQTLYSYLLTEKTFMLESIPGTPTKEKRFAHQLYLDTLTLFLDITDSLGKRGGQNPMADNRFIRMLAADDKVRSLRSKYRVEKSPFADSLPDLVTAVRESAVYKNYIKEHNHDSAADAKVWQHIFSTIIAVSPLFTTSVSGIENHSLRGVERMREMMMQTFMNFSSSQVYISDAVKTLRHSLDKARELYFRLLLLPVSITELRSRQIDSNRHKLLPTEEDLNPNLRFVENSFVSLLREDAVLSQYLEDKKISWLAEDAELMESLLEKIMASETYSQYMENKEASLQIDCDFWRNIFRKEIFTDENLLENLENKSVFWNDDIDIISTFVLKTVRRFETARGEEPVLSMYKDEEDASFGEDLFSYVLKNKDEYRKIIDSFVNKEQWDAERLAFMDVVVMMAAIAELIEFPKIPVSVTINEYVEIAKSYSTAKSGAFINGILASVVTQLRNDGRVVKE